MVVEEACELLVLKKGDLEELLEMNNGIREEMEEVMEKREKKNEGSLELVRSKNVQVEDIL